MGKWTELTILKRRSTNGQQIHEEMFNVIGHKEMKIKMTLKLYLSPVIQLLPVTQLINGDEQARKRNLYPL
jgi:hypothetical protein